MTAPAKRDPGLGEQLDAAVQEPGTVEVGGGAVRARVDVTEAGPVGVEVERIRVEGPKGDVAERAERVARGVSIAGEPLEPVEVAPELGGAILRTPAERMRGGRFHEAEVGEDAIEVRRHEVGPDGERRPAPIRLTREQLGQVVDDLARAFRDPLDADPRAAWG